MVYLSQFEPIMKLFATSILTFALLGIVNTASSLDGEACNEGEKQCALNGQLIDRCVNGEWIVADICKPGDICVENVTPLCASNPDGNVPLSAESDASAIEDLGNDGAEFTATEECRNGDAQCETLPLILLGRYAIKRCNSNHKWFTDVVCNREDVCIAEPYPHCVSLEVVDTREEGNSKDGDKDVVNAVQINKVELPCTKCKRFRDECTTNCYKSVHWRTRAWCQKTCINKMKDYFVEDGNHGTYRGTCRYYCPNL
ncbi:unnamed protein product [Alternaria alternata]